MAARDVLPSVEAEAEPPGEFERLRRFIRYHLGGFTLGLVRVNDPRQRDGARLVRVDLANHHPPDLRQAVLSDVHARAALEQDRLHAALVIVGLEHLLEAEAGESSRPPFAAALNAERDALPAPIILFLTDHAMDRLDLAAPDFFDWYSGIFRLRPAGAPETAELPARQLAEPRPPYPAALSPETLGARLELLEERRADQFSC